LGRQKAGLATAKTHAVISIFTIKRQSFSMRCPVILTAKFRCLVRLLLGPFVGLILLYLAGTFSSHPGLVYAANRASPRLDDPPASIMVAWNAACETVPVEAQAAVEAAAELWMQRIVSTIPKKVKKW
jgi:hypothetical protein